MTKSSKEIAGAKDVQAAAYCYLRHTGDLGSVRQDRVRRLDFLAQNLETINGNKRLHAAFKMWDQGLVPHAVQLSEVFRALRPFLTPTLQDKGGENDA